MILILGAGYTGSRVGALLEAGGHEWAGLRRQDLDFTEPGAFARLAELVPASCVVLHSIPSLAEAADARLLDALKGKASRVVYLSTTGVYGAATHVDATTPPAPRNPREQARVDTEHAVIAGPWESLILRPAAIYGPGRGVQVAMAKGEFKLLGDGSNYVSRIHVDDLARIATAALLSHVTGAYPVADAHPCPSREIAEFCADHFRLPWPVSASPDEVPPSRRNNRQVDGSEILRLLGVTLKYPSYRDALEPLSSPFD